MEITLTIVHVHSNTDNTISSVRIPLQSREQYAPLLQDIQACVQDMKPQLDPEEICLYWRMSDERFVPIYNYVTYSAAWAQLWAPRLYLVVRDARRGCAPKAWPRARADEPRPGRAFRARAADERLLAALFPPPPRGFLWAGHAREDAAPAAQVLDTLRGSCAPPGDDDLEGEGPPRDRKEAELDESKNSTSKSVGGKSASAKSAGGGASLTSAKST